MTVLSVSLVNSLRICPASVINGSQFQVMQISYVASPSSFLFILIISGWSFENVWTCIWEFTQLYKLSKIWKVIKVLRSCLNFIWENTSSWRTNIEHPSTANGFSESSCSYVESRKSKSAVRRSNFCGSLFQVSSITLQPTLLCRRQGYRTWNSQNQFLGWRNLIL